MENVKKELGVYNEWGKQREVVAGIKDDTTCVDYMVSNNEMAPMLAVREVAQILHIHINTVRRWSDQGMLTVYRISRRGDRRFRQEDIARFLAELNVHTGDERKASPSQGLAISKKSQFRFPNVCQAL